MKTIKYLSLRVFAVAALALVFALPTKAQMTERQLECSVLLVGIQTAAFAYGKCLATEILMVAMVVQESSQCKIVCQEVTAFKIHTPAA